MSKDANDSEDTFVEPVKLIRDTFPGTITVEDQVWLRKVLANTKTHYCEHCPADGSPCPNRELSSVQRLDMGTTDH